MCENILVNALLEFGTVYRQALLVLSHYCHSEILCVMSTSVYIYTGWLKNKLLILAVNEINASQTRVSFAKFIPKLGPS